MLSQREIRIGYLENSIGELDFTKKLRSTHIRIGSTKRKSKDQRHGEINNSRIIKLEETTENI